MLPIVAGLLAKAGEVLIDKVGKVITSKADEKEKQAAIKELVETNNHELQVHLVEAQKSLEEELTKRLQADMASDSWLAKNIRPMSIAFLLIFVAGVAVLNGNTISGVTVLVSDRIYDAIFNLLLIAFGFYFGRREASK